MSLNYARLVDILGWSAIPPLMMKKKHIAGEVEGVSSHWRTEEAGEFRHHHGA